MWAAGRVSQLELLNWNSLQFTGIFIVLGTLLAELDHKPAMHELSAQKHFRTSVFQHAAKALVQ